MGQVVDVQSAGSHVSGHEQLCQVVAELLHGQITLLLAQVTMKRLGIVSVLDELISHFLRLDLRATKDDGIDARVEIDNTFQREILVTRVDHIVDVVDVLGTFVARSDDDLLVVVEIVLRDGLYLLAHGGREKQGVAVSGHALKDLVDAFREAHVEHFVGLIKHDVVDLVELCHATFHQIDETAGGSHDDLHAVAQGMDLCLDRCSAVDGHNVHAVDILGKSVEIVGNLQAQLTCGAEDEGLSRFVGGVGLLQHGDAVGGCLACSCLCQCYDIVAVTEQIRDYFFLYGHGLLKAQLFDGAANRFADTQFFKCLQSLNL